MSVIKDVVSGIFGGSGAAKKAGDVGATSALQAGQARERLAREALPTLRGQQEAGLRAFERGRAGLQPFREAGARALEQEQAFLGVLGPEQQQAAFAGFAESPGQRFLQERGQRALLRNASATGGLGGGNIRSALVQQGVGFAQQDLQNQISRLGGLAGRGQEAAGSLAGLEQNLGGLQQQFGANVGNILTGVGAARGQALQKAGQARASGILGAQQAQAGLGQQVLGAGLGAAAGGGLLGAGAAGLFGGSAGGGALIGLLSDMRFKTNIKKIGELDSGIGWYEWQWKEDAPDCKGALCVGVLAQEVQQKMPEAVIEVDGYLRVNYEVLH